MSYTDEQIREFLDIENCNVLGDFVLAHYYATNGEIPDKDGIEEIIKIVMES